MVSGSPVDNVLFNKVDVLTIKSDSDPQILINLAFMNPVKLKNMVIRGGSDPKTRPKTIKLFKNRVTADFEECENDEPTQSFVLKDADFTGKTELKFVKFQPVTSLTVRYIVLRIMYYCFLDLY